MVSDVNIGTALNQQANTNNAQTGLAQDFNQFLILLTTQLQNQDPLSPMDTTEFTNQLVAFSGVEQQINTNQKLDSLVSLSLGNAVGNSLGYVGMDISYLSSEFNFDGAEPVKLNYAYNSEPFEAKIRIVNEEGETVYETDAEKGLGNNEFVWDGTTKDGTIAPEGTYEIRVDALDFDGNAVSTTTVVNGRVRGVESQNGLIFLLVGERAVSLGQVLNVSVPETDPLPPDDDGDDGDDGDGGDGSGDGSGDP